MASPVISTASRIGLYALVMMADKREELFSVGQIAEAFSVSDNHVAKVMQQLSRAGFVRSVRGAGGGYHLEGDPAEISMADVVEVLDGPMRSICFGCEGRLAGDCGHFASCVVRDVLTELGDRTVRTFRQTSIAKLARKGRRRGGVDESCLRRRRRARD